MANRKLDLIGGRALRDPAFVALQNALNVVSGVVLPPDEEGVIYFVNDASGNLVSVSGESFQTNFTYDSSGNVFQVEKNTPSINVLKTIDYNSSGEVASITVSNI